ncbi:Dihydrolipoyllysine-residue acetyltransferase component of pyruvate dehydrogenase complex [Streptomyces sp. ADI97-07]|uniref:dihydrolipoamide acetyltransferase family protein n=1 Tax=Streptomyces sp. ADI97-07 TaxID=1522762 RepID=UPI000F54F81D|nr:dihydrolipoamide acetyltransferase family protein [Streptomyces sp. ADI97-07]RPK84792.1 Dihydrolipoyllysine-residue acetyltransferase component of pyruvate dehydrogenase complex [Streptomyces sp. ADI97-07]
MTDTAVRVREFRMPDVGEGLTEAEVLTWHVRPGDTVTDGQVVCEIETAKAVVELPVPFDGVVHELRCGEGETVDVGQVIISVSVAEAAAVPPPRTAPQPPPPERLPVLVGYGVGRSSTKRRPRKPVVPGPAPVPGRALAKPPVRKLAKDLGVDLATVVPSGPGGVVTRDDVHAAVVPLPVPAPDATAAPQAALAATAAPPVPAERETRTPVKGVRKATAAAVTASAFTAPHVTEFVTVDVTRTMRLVAELGQDPQLAGCRVTPMLLVAKALLVAVGRNPGINATWDGAAQEIVRKHYVNLGIAAATPRGLIVPNIKDAHTMSLPQLASAITELVSTAREGGTSPAALRGGSITLTNIGVFGIDAGTPILNPGESAILAVGAIGPRPWIHKGRIKPRQVVTLALSFDHRLVDGELGSMFLADVAAVLERPRRLLTWG